MKEEFTSNAEIDNLVYWKFLLVIRALKISRKFSNIACVATNFFKREICSRGKNFLLNKFQRKLFSVTQVPGKNVLWKGPRHNKSHKKFTPFRNLFWLTHGLLICVPFLFWSFYIPISHIWLRRHFSNKTPTKIFHLKKLAAFTR